MRAIILPWLALGVVSFGSWSWSCASAQEGGGAAAPTVAENPAAPRSIDREIEEQLRELRREVDALRVRLAEDAHSWPREFEAWRRLVEQGEERWPDEFERLAQELLRRRAGDARDPFAPARPPRGALLSPTDRSAFLGVEFGALSENEARELGLEAPSGLRVLSVVQGAPADAGGLRTGDVIAEVDGRAADEEVFLSTLRLKQPGGAIRLKVVRVRADGTRELETKRFELASRGEFRESIERIETPAIDLAPSARDRSESPGAPRTPASAPGTRAREPVALGLRLAQENFVLYVQSVEPGGNAAEAGLQSGDEVIAIAGRRVKTVESVEDVLHQLAVGDSTSIRYRRAGRDRIATITLGGAEREPELIRIEPVDHSATDAQEHPAPVPAPAPPAVAERRAPGHLGVEIDTTERGVKVKYVDPRSAAKRIGIVPGDVIHEVDGHPVLSPRELRERIEAHAAGDSVSIRIQRGEESLELRGELGER